jgi:hypothetical protein
MTWSIIFRERWTHFGAFAPTHEDPAGIFDRVVIETAVESSFSAERK